MFFVADSSGGLLSGDDSVVGDCADERFDRNILISRLEELAMVESNALVEMYQDLKTNNHIQENYSHNKQNDFDKNLQGSFHLTHYKLILIKLTQQ